MSEEGVIGKRWSIMVFLGEMIPCMLLRQHSAETRLCILGFKNTCQKDEGPQLAGKSWTRVHRCDG